MDGKKKGKLSLHKKSKKNGSSAISAILNSDSSNLNETNEFQTVKTSVRFSGREHRSKVSVTSEEDTRCTKNRTNTRDTAAGGDFGKDTCTSNEDKPSSSSVEENCVVGKNFSEFRR